jgi:hypothetical protein
VIVVGELVGVIYGTAGTDKFLIKETRASQAVVPHQAWGWEGAAQLYHMERKAILSRE